MSGFRLIAAVVAIALVTLAADFGARCAWAGQSGAATAAAVRTAGVELAEANAASRVEYARARTAALAKVGPIIEVYEGDKVVLVRGAHRTEERFDPPESPNLKAVAHVPLAVWAALDLAGDQPIPEARIVELRTFRERIASARSSLNAAAFGTSPLDRQIQMLDASIAMLDDAMARRSVGRAEIGVFARRMAPLMLANVREAARGEIDLLHSIVSRWRSELTAEEWSSLHVVIMGVHMARDGELSQQYFVRLLGEPGEGRRVVYAEGIFDEARALDMLGTHLIDGRAGAAFFGFDMRMHRDILADAARERLDELGIGP
jgi:hypothetical protein